MVEEIPIVLLDILRIDTLGALSDVSLDSPRSVAFAFAFIVPQNVGHLTPAFLAAEQILVDFRYLTNFLGRFLQQGALVFMMQTGFAVRSCCNAIERSPTAAQMRKTMSNQCVHPCFL